jgi:hypothetical protein
MSNGKRYALSLRVLLFLSRLAVLLVWPAYSRMRGDRAAARGPRDTEKYTAAARVGYAGAGQEGGGGVP